MSLKEKVKLNYVRPLLKIAVPIILSNIIGQVQMLIDRIFLGRMDDLYMSALSNVSSPMWTTMSVVFSIVTGASIIISQKVGANEKEGILQYSASTFKWNNAFPFFLFFFWIIFAKYIFRAMNVSEAMMPMCMDYLLYISPIFLVIGFEASSMVVMQTSNYTKPLIWFGLIRSVANIFLDWVLIFGNLGFPALGIKGAAIATTIAEYLGFAYAIFVFVTSDKLFTRPHFKDVLKASPIPYLKSAKLGVNTAFEDFAWNFGNLLLIRILNSINEKAAGIYTIIFSVEIIAVVVVGALGQGSMTLSSEAYGRKDRLQYKGVCRTAYIISASLALALFVMCILFPKQIISLFSKDKSVIMQCSFFLILMCLNLFSKFGNIVVGCCIRGSGNTKWMFITQIFGTILVVSCAYVFVNVFKLGIAGVFFAVLTDEFLRCVVNVIKFVSIERKITKEN